jgi:hypothetical protein
VERRNPYLVLGLPFGASREEAVRSFARRTKFLRRATDPSSRARHTDLTGALHEIESAAAPAEARMSPYRIPADPELAALSSSAELGHGVFAPPPVPLDVEPDLGELRRAAAFELLRAVVRTRGERLGPPSP